MKASEISSFFFFILVHSENMAGDAAADFKKARAGGKVTWKAQIPEMR